MTLTLVATNSTVIKRSNTEDSSRLPESGKFKLPKGASLSINWVKEAPKNHFYFELAKPMKGFYNWYAYCPDVKVPLPHNSFAGRILHYMKLKGYQISEGAGNYNIVYVEGCNADGTLNDDKANHFNDRRILLEVVDGNPKIVGNWDATTEPGYYYTDNPMNPKGAARIQFGQYVDAWEIGTHGNAYPHEALIQVAPVTVCRDANRSMTRTGDALDTGLFGINQHGGYDYAPNDIQDASAGCLVGRTMAGQAQFMEMLSGMPNRYFTTTVIPGDQLPKM